MKRVFFSPPDITQAEIDAVTEVLRSGWITTGPRTQAFEESLASFLNVSRVVCMNSATAGMEMILRYWGIGPGDEVITTPLTFAATVNVILHVGAKPVLVDIEPGTYHLSPALVEKAINRRTKAILAVDYGGWPADYERLLAIAQQKSHLFHPKKNTPQTWLGRVLVMADAAHSLGATYHGKKVGSVADVSVFSFHAVKNLTTAEGGCISWSNILSPYEEKLERGLRLLMLHGQNKDARQKYEGGNWRYDIELPGYKCNLPDIAAAIGLSQLKRYDAMLSRRKQYFQMYNEALKTNERVSPPFHPPWNNETSYHLYPLQVEAERRDQIIQELAHLGIQANVHFIPIYKHPAYRFLRLSERQFPVTEHFYQREISLPLSSAHTPDDITTVIEGIQETLKKL
ncbi:DegT/DnrJ/EryC1/StrS family aminotransferase [Thermospira aquatica]|uniref:DegT/DnrJ/EryC1/StrS aminotransferase family protein n=1 Tax=Thermospira aquatica TaxID=2828656 RepID=A0AAX3BFL6_9SPIR|nr:DegT/DnrJ/EryC1/StrS aminotransferase family protein [Thermospira aquatica]URA11090.1 DegT/DnrJ/EryC1/StrS aminotransferase family protein [Thermospira aquatica]